MTLRLLASGRDADVYALDGRRVLRRYRHGGDVAAEAAVMAYVHRHGLPVPEVFAANGTDLVMARVDGPTLLASMVAGDTGAATAAELLADLHTSLHALPARQSRDPRPSPAPPLRPAGSPLQPVASLPAPDQAATRILHLDLHPANVILGASGPVLIDWRNATEGPPDLDVALTALILAEAAVGLHEVPAELVPMAQDLLAVFVRRAAGAPLDQLDQAVALRASDPNLLPAEKARLTEAATRVRIA